jgi:hypothetical protein
MVQAIRTAGAGRAGFKVGGLYRSKSPEKLLESQLAPWQDISLASANALTGIVLVCYHSGNTPQTIAALIEGIVADCLGQSPPALPTPVLHQAQAAPEGADRATVLGRFKDLLAYPAEPQAKLRSGWKIFFSQFNSLPVAVHA